jgi:uncharacterized protein with von Willebrand factor type A (vWA) domain
MIAENTNIPRASGRGLIENIVRFSDVLRQNDVSISLPAVLDAIQGLPLIDISNRDAFQCLLRVNFVCRREDIAKFDKLFQAYWLPGFQNKLMRRSEENDKAVAKEEPDAVSTFLKTMVDTHGPGDAEAEIARDWNVHYSPDAHPKQDQPLELHFTQSKAVYESISKLLQSLTHRLSRRFKYTLHGKEISLRRILRKNMQFGGELILLDFKKKKLKKRRVIFLCDVSGSMDIYTLMILQFIHALKRIDRRTEIFFFSTDLSRGTNHFDEDDFVSAISKLPEIVADWGGGTRIGHCLGHFNEAYGKGMLSSKSIVMIFSDGWDRGEVDILGEQMARLKRKAHKIIWLNPLSGTKDYQPICQGMSAALPYVDFFLPMGAWHDLKRLGRMLQKLIA